MWFDIVINDKQKKKKTKPKNTESIQPVTENIKLN